MTVQSYSFLRDIKKLRAEKLKITAPCFSTIEKQGVPHLRLQVFILCSGIEAGAVFQRIQVVMTYDQRLGRLHEAVLTISADCTAVPRYACRQVALGCPAHPRSRRLSSGRCVLCSGLQPSIPDDQALSSRCVAPHNGSRCRTSSPACGGRCQSGLQTTAGRADKLSSGR